MFVLREGFDVEYDELQAIFNKKKDYCRQLVSRAKRKLLSEVESGKGHLTQDPDLEGLIINAGSTGKLEELKFHLTQKSAE